MMKALYEILPLIAIVLFVVAAIAAAVRPNISWKVPAAAAFPFLLWSIFTVAHEGMAGVWREHTRNAWGNQIWLDLLIAIAIAWSVLLPRARAAGMRTWPWLVLILSTGCIGLAAMFARCRYLESRNI